MIAVGSVGRGGTWLVEIGWHCAWCLECCKQMGVLLQFYSALFYKIKLKINKILIQF
jgi:hypothetical protein